MKPPLVSVNMPVFNGRRFVGEAIESVLTQSFSDFEFIIVDDGSTDGTVEVIRDFKDPRIKLVQNNANLGLARTRNKAIKASRGKYIAILDSDDRAYPQRLQKQVSFLETHSDHCLVCSWVDYIDQEGAAIGGEYLRYKDNEMESALFFHDCIAQSTVMLRKSLLPSLEPYNTGVLITEDYLLWIELAKEHKMHILQEPLAQYRKHTTNTSTGIKELVDKMLREIIRQQWREIGLQEISSHEEDLQLCLAFDMIRSDIGFVAGVSKLCRKIIRANRKSERYSAIHFEAVVKNMANKVLQPYFDQEKYGWKEIRGLFGRGVSGAYFLPKKKVVSIAAKAVINYRSEN